MNKDKLCEFLSNKALDESQRSYDERSRTHIIFCLEIGKFGTRGIGAFADDAFENFKANLEAELNGASFEQLTNWYEKMSNPPAQRIAHSAPNEPVGKKQIGLLTKRTIHDALEEAAAEAGRSQSDLAGELIELEYQELNKAAFTTSGVEIRQRLKSTYRQTGAGKEIQWGVRIPGRLFTKIALFAKEFDVTIPEVCTHLIQAGLHKRKGSAAANQLQAAV